MTPATRRRFLRPTRLIPLDSGLWAIDEFQPVAAILDPDTGEVRRLVSWPELPPPPVGLDWPGPVALGDDDGLWVQQHRTGPLLRLDSQGRQSAAWTDGLYLAAARHGEAWCIPMPPQQPPELRADQPPDSFRRLLRVRADGVRDDLVIDRAVHLAFTTADALVLWVDDAPLDVTHDHTGRPTCSWTPRYLHIPWGAWLPERLEVASWPSSSLQRPDEIIRVPRLSWHQDEIAPSRLFSAAGVHWQVGRDEHSLSAFPFPSTRVLASMYTSDGSVIRTHQLGAGSPVTAAAAGDAALCVAVRRRGSTRPVELVTLRTESDAITTFLAPDTVDITELCWSLVARPLDVDSYGREVLARNSSVEKYWRYPEGLRPLARGMSDVVTTLRGEWPVTRLEWTFRWSGRPGLRLRRSVALFDELGRSTPPEFADIHLAEDLETGQVPLATDARDGILDL